MTTESGSLPRPSSEVLATMLPDGETVLLDLGSEAYFGLNEMGSAVWAVLESGGDLDALISTTSEESGVDIATVRADVEALLAELVARNLAGP